MGIDPKFYCQRAIGLDEVTPWSHMDYGVTHEYLVRGTTRPSRLRPLSPATVPATAAAQTIC